MTTDGSANQVSTSTSITFCGKDGVQEYKWVLIRFNMNGNREIRGSWSVPAKSIFSNIPKGECKPVC